MPFTRENAKRLRGPGGRPKRRVVEEKKEAAQIIRDLLSGNAEMLGTHYIRRSKKNDRVLCHAIDKLMPDEHAETQPQAIYIAIGQFSKPSTGEAQPEFRADGIAIRIGSGNGQNGSGEDSP